MALRWNKTSLARRGNALVLTLAMSGPLLSLAAGIQAIPRFQPKKPQELDLEKITSPALSAALTSSDRLWNFLTAPNTPYRERLAAAVQGKRVFSLDGFVRLVTTQDALRAEHELHRWGLEVRPNYGALAPLPLRPLSPQEHRRHLLGRVWAVPETPTGFEPDANNLAEMQKAPWPLQVETALNLLYQAITPQMHVNNLPSEVTYAEQWYAEAFKLPCKTDRQAMLFLNVTLSPRHYKSLRLLARWRQVALDPRFPQTAARVAAECGEAMRLWGDERAQDIGQAILGDILRNSRDLRVREEAAWSSRHLLERFTPDGDIKLAPPMQVVVALGDLAMAPKTGSEWDRLYGFVNSVFALLPDAPLREDINGLDPKSPHVHALLADFAVWFRARRAEFVCEGENQPHALAEIAAVRGTKF